MNQILELTRTYEIEVELPDELDVAKAVADLRARLDTEPVTLMHGTVERPTRVLFQSVAIRPPFKPRPDEFSCDSCLREFSNDEKYVDGEGDELCSNCKGGE